MAGHKSEGGLSPDPDAASFLILDFTASRTMRNRCLLFKPPGLWDSEQPELTYDQWEPKGQRYEDNPSLRTLGPNSVSRIERKATLDVLSSIGRTSEPSHHQVWFLSPLRLCSSPPPLLAIVCLSPTHLEFGGNGLFLAGVPTSPLWGIFLKYHCCPVFSCLKAPLAPPHLLDFSA